MEQSRVPVKIPASWENSPKLKTLTELQSHRKASKIPDPSFDLDGDGIVNGHDLVISSQFDLDKDGKLSSAERAEALKALSQGYSGNFLWGCESSGLNRSFRIVQKRGKIIPNEEFSLVKDTYPGFPAGFQSLTKSEVIEKRRIEDQTEAKKNEGRINSITQKIVPIDSFLSKDQYVEHPLYTSMLGKKCIESKIARQRAGLSLEPEVSRNADVKFEYRESPGNLSLSEMKMAKKECLVGELNASADYSHVTFYKKVENEKCFAGPKGRILRDVLWERRSQDVSHLENTFVQKLSGIHGKELPKFEDNLNYIEGKETLNPYMNPFVGYQKEYHRIENKVENVTLKPNQIVHDFCEMERKTKVSSKFTEYYSQFMPYNSVGGEVAKERIKLEKVKKSEKKDFRFLVNSEPVPLITHRLLHKIESLSPRYKSITSTGFSLK